MKSRVLLIALLLPLAQVFAQKKMTLGECVEYGLANHRSVKVYNNEIQVANEKGNEAVSYYLPQVTGTATFDDNLKRQTTIIPGAFAGQSQDLKVQFGQQFASGAVVQVDQTIYDQSMINSLKANKPNKEISRLKKEQNDQNLIYNASAAYCEALIYQEKVKILAENEKKYKDLTAITKLRYEKGVVQKIEYDRININLRNIVAEKTLAETNKEMSLNKLKNAIGLPLEEEIDVVDSVDYNKLISLSEREANFDVTKLLDYKIQVGNIRLQEVDLKRKRSAFLPTLTAYGRYGFQSFSNDFSRALDNKFDYSAVGLKLTVPIFSGMKRSSQANQSSLALKSAKENFQINNDNLKLQYLNSNTKLTKSLSDLNTNQGNLELAEEVFETTTLQYQKGTALMSDLINADYSLKEAQNNYITAVLNVLSSTLQYEQSKGTLRDYFSKF